MSLPIPLDFPPMEAELAAKLPADEGWLYEPKWDGFRCLAFKDGSEVHLRSKAGKPLERYFPDVVDLIASISAPRVVLDGEIVVPVNGHLVFDELLLRIHPAESRVRTLVEAHPAHFIAFDLLVDARGKDRTGEALKVRRALLEELDAKVLAAVEPLHVSPVTEDVKLARRWLGAGRQGLDGVMAKRGDLPYAPGERTAMRKVKRVRSADCVIGGFRWSKNGRTVGSLLLGLYGDDGLLHHVGFCSALNATIRKEAEERVLPLRGGAGFTGRAPVGHSRWRKEGTGEWEPLEPELVVEVEYDHFSSGRFRHGTKFARWRPDKAPDACRLEQVEKEGRNALAIL